MARPFEFHDGARADFDESFHWYAARSAGTAVGFAAAVDEALEKIDANPARFQSTHGGCRLCPLSRYPFRVIFREQPERIIVVAIAHAKRRPNFWRSRIRGQ